MKRVIGILIVLVAALTAGACGGDGSSSDEPPWGLDKIHMPDTEEEVAAVFAAFPEEIDGYPRSVGLNGVMYGETDPDGVAVNPLGFINSIPLEQIRQAGQPDTGWTIVEWLTWIASPTSDFPPVVGNDLDPNRDVIWVTNREPDLGDNHGVYMVHWAQPNGSVAFKLFAMSEAGQRQLVEAFVTAASG